MTNVVIVTKHLFMNENGVDYALGVSASDILPFSNMEKAIDYVEEQIKVAYADEPNFDRYDWGKEDCMYQGVSQMVSFSQYSYNNRGIRTAFRIVKRKID